MNRILFIALFLLVNKSVFAQNTESYDKDIQNTQEGVSDKNARYVYDKIMSRMVNNSYKNKNDNDTIFGVHGMEIPSVAYDGDLDKQDKAFQLLSRAGVDSLRSTEAAWHRISNKNGDPKFLDNLKYQLVEAKKYNMSHLFVVGYPPAKYTVAHNKLSAVNPMFINRYKDYLNVLMNTFKGYDVRYLELGNEVDAPEIWWKKSTPQMYVNEMQLLKEAINKSNEKIKTIAFSATYSRKEGMGGDNGGRSFLNKSFALGIDKYADAYSLHHFDMNKYDSFPLYMHGLLMRQGIKKPLYDTEQLDTGYKSFSESKPFDIIKIYTRGFFLYKLKMIDYFNAKDIYLGNRLYSIGLFDKYWRPKLRLLAYAMAVDSLKGRELISIAEPKPRVEAYILKNRNNDRGYKYTIVMWSDNDGSTVEVGGLHGDMDKESWDLNISKLKSENVKVDNKPIAIYTNVIPSWVKSKIDIDRNSNINMKNIIPG